jgi:hypothetical protein
MAFWYILFVIWYISPRFGILYKEKSGNPGLRLSAFTLRILLSFVCDLFLRSEAIKKVGYQCQVFSRFRPRDRDWRQNGQPVQERLRQS